MTQPNPIKLSHESRVKRPSFPRPSRAGEVWPTLALVMSRADGLVPKSACLNNSRQNQKTDWRDGASATRRFVSQIFRCNGRPEWYAADQFTQ